MSTMDPSNETFCLYAQYFIPPLDAIAALSMIYPMYLYGLAYKQNKIKSSNFLFWAGTIYFITLLVCYTDHMIYHLLWCTNNTAIYKVFRTISIQLYVPQSVMIAGILFGRLSFIFKATSFAISMRTTIIYISLVTVAVILGACGTIMFYNTSSFQDIGSLLIAIGGFFYLIILITLNALFINKLVKVYKVNTDGGTKSNARLMNIITKTSILCFTSTWCIMLHLISDQFRDLVDSPHYYFFTVVVYQFDLYTNFLSVFLSFSHFGSLYMKCCGCCDRNCHSFWNRCVNGKNSKKMQLERMKSETSQTVMTSDASTLTPGSMSPQSSEAIDSADSAL